LTCRNRSGGDPVTGKNYFGIVGKRLKTRYFEALKLKHSMVLGESDSTIFWGICVGLVKRFVQIVYKEIMKKRHIGGRAQYAF
jgi:hypothetical protein